MKMNIKNICSSAKSYAKKALVKSKVLAKKALVFAKSTSKKIWAFIKRAFIFIKNWVLSHKKYTAIIASSLCVIAVAIVLIANHARKVEISKQGYRDILVQLEENTYSDPVDGDLVVNRAGWIVNMQPIATAEEAVKKLAQADKDHNIQLFVGYKVDTNEKIVKYAFISVDDNGERYTIFASQGTNGKIIFEQTDYAEIDTIFATAIEED